MKQEPTNRQATMHDFKKSSLWIIRAAVCAIAMQCGSAGAQAPEAAPPADAPAKVDATVKEQTVTEQAGKASQKHIDAMDDEATSMVAEYRQALAETTSLKTYNDQMAVQVKSQNDEMADLNRQLGQVDGTARDVLPLMDNMLATLEQFVQLDTPFLADERAKRIATLKEMMGRADVSLSEKFRRIVEAYQIEMEYGRTLESYQGKVGDKTVDFLRVGRVALQYQTLDGKETGYWDADSKSFKGDNSYGEDIKAALKVAKKQAAPDFLTVPLHAPTEAK